MSERTRILLVESDQKMAMAITAGLNQQGFEVVSSRDAVYALNVARQTRPDTVVLNSQLAGGGGLVALKRIRSNVHTAHIPVIMMIGRIEAKQRETLLAAGAQECLAQPASANALSAAIRKHLPQSLDFTQAPAEILADPGRIAALQDTGLIDSVPEEQFDRLARLVSGLLGTPIALMTLVDKDRQFFKSQIGLGQPWAGQRQSRLSHSFCQWVVSGQEPLVVEDARAHPVLRTNLAITDMGVVAYAGVPLSAGSGQPIGSLCAIDSRPRTWSEDDLATLQDLARVADAYTGLRRADGATVAGNSAALQFCGGAIQGLTRVLHRHGDRLDAAGRSELVDVIRQKARQLMKLAG